MFIFRIGKGKSSKNPLHPTWKANPERTDRKNQPKLQRRTIKSLHLGLNTTSGTKSNPVAMGIQSPKTASIIEV